ncbi:hypothetical protein VF21_03507 [Pseudogymnoascus sp. 05NY08]|nr:hypothetical protein VF21_03507 [Pseudogymnoascus sp. 05NY08]
MRDIITPLLNGLRSPFIGNQAPDSPNGDSKSQLPERKTSLAIVKSSFIGSQAPDPPHGDSKSRLPKGKMALAILKSPFVGHKPSFGDFKSPFLGHKILIPIFRGLKSPFIGGKAPDPLLAKPKSTFPGLSIFKSLKPLLIGSKDPKVITTPVPVPVPIPPERFHIPPYHHLVDYEIGYYDNGDALDAFMASLPNLPKGYRYRERVMVPGFGDPHLLGLPANVRFRIYQFMTKSVRAKNKIIVLSPDRTINGFWPKKHFMEPQTVFDVIGGLSLTCFQLRHEVLTYYCSQFHFHITYNCFCTPISAPLMYKWLPLFGNKMQYLTVEVDFTRLGGCYQNGKFTLKHGAKETMFFIRKLVFELCDRSGAIRSLHIMCRRYKGFRPPSQKYTPEDNIPVPNISDNTEPPADGTSSDGTSSDGTSSDGTSSDGTSSDGTPSDGATEDGAQDGSDDGSDDWSEDETSQVSTSVNSSVIAELSHGDDTSNTDESPTENDKPDKNVPIKYCPSHTTTVLDYLPCRLGRKGMPLYHLRLSGFGKKYTKDILSEIGSVGNGPTLLITPKVPPWPRDYPEVQAGITTTDGDYLGTIVKFVNDKETADVEKPRTGRMTATKKFLIRALTRLSLARAPKTTLPEPAFDYRELFATFYDSDEETGSDKASEDEDNPEYVGLGIQLPNLPRHPNNKYSLMRMYEIERDIKKQLEEPDDLPTELAVELIELWAIDSISTRFGNLFGVSTATRGLPKDRRPPIVVNHVHKAFHFLFKHREKFQAKFQARTPNITVRMATIPEIQEQLQEINATSSTLSGLFNFPEPEAPAAGQSQMNRLWNLGLEHGGLSHLARQNSLTNSTFYTDASESTLDMGYSDPTIPAQLPNMQGQDVDSSSTLCELDDGSETRTIGRNSNEDLGQPEELWDREDEQQDDSLLALYTVSTSSTYDTDGTRSRSNTDRSEILDWPLPNTTMPPPPPTRPPPPVPAVGNQLHQIVTVSSRRTLRSANEDNLHQIPTLSSRKTLRFDLPEETEEEEEARIARSDSFREIKREQQERQIKEAQQFQDLNSLFNYSAEPVPRGPVPRRTVPRRPVPREPKPPKPPKEPKGPKKQRSRSGSFWSKGKAKDDADDKPSHPPLRTVKSFPSSAFTREAPNDPRPASRPDLKEKRSISHLFRRKNKEPKDVEEVEAESNNFNSLFNDSSANIQPDIPADKGTIGRSSRARGFWKRNKGNAQPDPENENAPHPPLRSTRSFSFNPLRLRRRSSTINPNTTELPDNLPEEEPGDLSNEETNEQPDELSNDLTNDPSNESTEPVVPAAAAPTPEPRARARGFFSHLRKKTSKLFNAQEIDTMSSNLSQLFNGSSATIVSNTNESTGGRQSVTTGRESVVSGRQSVATGRESTMSQHESVASGRQSAASGRQSATPSTGYNSFSRNLGRRGAAGGSIFGPNGGRKDGRGSLADVRWGAGAGMDAPTGLREVREAREARERREREEREEREIDEEIAREVEIERRELEELRERERMDRERRGDRGQLGLSRAVATVDSDDEEEGYVV